MKFNSIKNNIKDVSIHLLDFMFDTAAFLSVVIEVLSIYIARSILLLIIYLYMPYESKLDFKQLFLSFGM